MKDFSKGGNDQKQLRLIIEGKLHIWHEQYITGAQIKELASLDPVGDLYLSISNPWKDELIENDQKVNLALPEIEHFFTRKALNYKVNGVEFSSNKQFINGSFIRMQGNIRDEDVLYLLGEPNWKDNLIEDDEWVDLARPGKEHFVSKKPDYCIIVNLKEKQWNAKKISYEDVVKLAFPNYEPTKFSYTVKYTDGPKKNPEGSMSAGDIVHIQNKMTFHVSPTNKS
jgi:hypothetical protein